MGNRGAKVIRVGTKVGFSSDDVAEFENLVELQFFALRSGLEARPEQVGNADVVVLLGGGSGTADVAYEAAWQHRPTIPAIALGGTAAQWRKALSRRLVRLGALDTEVRAIQSEFNTDAIMRLVQRFTTDRT